MESIPLDGNQAKCKMPLGFRLTSLRIARGRVVMPCTLWRCLQLRRISSPLRCISSQCGTPAEGTPSERSFRCTLSGSARSQPAARGTSRPALGAGVGHLCWIGRILRNSLNNAAPSRSPGEEEVTHTSQAAHCPGRACVAGVNLEGLRAVIILRFCPGTI